MPVFALLNSTSFPTPFEVRVGGEEWYDVKAGWPRYCDTVWLIPV